jgi:hypothetical protein
MPTIKRAITAKIIIAMIKFIYLVYASECGG